MIRNAPFHIRQVAPDDQPQCYALIGPDGKVWHRSWSRHALILRGRDLARAYRLGRQDGLRRLCRPGRAKR